MTEKSSNEVLTRWFWNYEKKKPELGFFRKKVDNKGFVTIIKLTATETGSKGHYLFAEDKEEANTNWVAMIYENKHLLLFNTESKLRNAKERAEKELEIINNTLKDITDYNIAKELEK